MYIFYNELYCLSIYFWKYYEYPGNIPHCAVLQKTSLCKSAKAYFLYCTFARSCSIIYGMLHFTKKRASSW